MKKRILVLGASGLIGSFIAADLVRRGHPVVPVARSFTAAQRAFFDDAVHELSVTALHVDELMALLRDRDAEMVVNCIGLLQSRPGEEITDAHDAFVGKLLAALKALGRPVLLVHVSIPGEAGGDQTDFSTSKRKADRQIIASEQPYAILRPGFVFAPAPYGGSALLRALAALPLQLHAYEAGRPFRFVAIEDVAESIALLADRWKPEHLRRATVWDLMHPEPLTVGNVVGALRRWLGAEWRWRFTLGRTLLDYGAKAGDLSVWLGWSPPVRTTAIAEMRRGVEGDPQPWMESTGIKPRSLASVLAARPATVQDKWFARLYVLKAAILASLVAFWCLSGLIALAVYPAAHGILTSHGFPNWLAHIVTVASSLTDIAIGIAIAFKRTSRTALMAGITVSLGYMAGAAVLTPDLWIEPLGALVKTGPAIVLMAVALAISDER